MKKLLALLYMLAAIPLAHGTSLVQSANGSYITTGNPTVSTSSHPTAGDTLIFVLPEEDTGVMTIGCSGVADNQGNSFTRIVTTSGDSGSLDGGNAEVWALYNIGSTSGTYTVTCTLATANSAITMPSIMEVSGVGAADITAQATTGGTAETTQTLTAASANTNASDFEVSVIGVHYQATSATSIPSGFTSINNCNSGCGQRAFTVAYRIPGSIETMAATWSWTNAAVSGAALASFKPAGGGITHACWTPSGRGLVPTAGSTLCLLQSGSIGTVDGSSVEYKQAQGAFGVN